jgi:hypothetical protein
MRLDKRMGKMAAAEQQSKRWKQRRRGLHFFQSISMEEAG